MLTRLWLQPSRKRAYYSPISDVCLPKQKRNVSCNSQRSNLTLDIAVPLRFANSGLQNTTESRRKLAEEATWLLYLMLFSASFNSTQIYSTLFCPTLRYSTVPYSTLLYSTPWGWTPRVSHGCTIKNAIFTKKNEISPAKNKMQPTNPLLPYLCTETVECGRGWSAKCRVWECKV